MRYFLPILITLLSVCMQAIAGPAWEIPILKTIESKAIESKLIQAELDAANWVTSDSATKLSSIPDPLNPDQKEYIFDINVDYNNPGEYPVGWPSFQATFNTVQDWSAWDGIQFTVKAESDTDIQSLPLRVICRDGGILHLVRLKRGETNTFTVPFGSEMNADKNNIKFLHYYVDESDYKDKDHIKFTISNIRLVKIGSVPTPLPEKAAGVELYIGKNSEAVILSSGTKKLQGKTVVHSGPGCILKSTDQLVYKATELFSGKVLSFKSRLNRDMAENQKIEIPLNINLEKLKAKPGYYWITCDITRDGKSLLDGRVGFEDFYIKKPKESMTYTVLSLRTAMGLYIFDPYGGYGRGSASFLHTYDPRDASHFAEFMRAYKGTSSKHTEGLEAGVAGTVFAAYAFRNSGDIVRAKFTEKLLKSNCDYMVKYMQKPDGSVITQVNAYYDKHMGEYPDEATAGWAIDTNQIGEWLRAIARVMIYLNDVPGEKQYVMKLYKAGRKAADYMAGVTTDQIGNRKHVIRHYLIDWTQNPPTKQIFHQEGRQCDVYVPRAMSGISYFAYAMHLMNEEIPQSYLDMLKDTTEWAMEKMKQDTYWFDWQCGYEVENGCHSFLGNQYLAEATQGYYLLCAARRDVEDAKLAAECTRRALRFLTDTERTMVGNQPVLELWVGPYLYWQFTEYLGSIGYEKPFADYLAVLHKGWAVDRKWKDFTQRGGSDMIFRADDLSHLTMATPAYPGLRYLEEIGKPFKYKVPTLAELTK